MLKGLHNLLAGVLSRLQKSPSPRRRKRRRIRTAARWQDNVMRLQNGLYQTDARIPGLKEKISLIRLTDGVAYELASARSRVEAEFYKDILKVLIYNQSAANKITKLVFVAKHSDAQTLEDGFAGRVAEWADNEHLDVEVIGV